MWLVLNWTVSFKSLFFLTPLLVLLLCLLCLLNYIFHPFCFLFFFVLRPFFHPREACLPPFPFLLDLCTNLRYFTTKAISVLHVLSYYPAWTLTCILTQVLFINAPVNGTCLNATHVPSYPIGYKIRAMNCN